jgi:hypothetical protein
MAKTKLITEITEQFIEQFQKRYGLEPKKINRFHVEFPEELNKISAFSVCSVTRPIWEKNKGWKEIRFKLYDFITPSTSEILFDALHKYNNSEKKDLEFIVNVLDPCGVKIETWTINGEISVVDFGGLDHSSEDLSYILMSVEPNWITLS